jgi:hypothetical protein
MVVQLPAHWVSSSICRVTPACCCMLLGWACRPARQLPLSCPLPVMRFTMIICGNSLLIKARPRAPFHRRTSHVDLQVCLEIAYFNHKLISNILDWGWVIESENQNSSALM